MPRLLLAAAGALAAAIGAAIAQEPPIFKTQSELVVLHVLVKDRNGSYVGGLTADAFEVLEENRPQTISFFTPEDAPVTVGLLIDSSGSMGPVRDRVIAASAAFIQSSNPQDESFAVVFNDDVRPVPQPPAHFVSDANTLRSLLSDAFVPAGRTRLYDAVAEGLSHVTTGTRDRRVLVVLSDGGDNASQSTFSDALMLTQASNVVVYTVALVDPLNDEANPKRLRQLADASGGAAFTPHDVRDVDKAFQQIARDIRSSYTIGYQPANTRLRPGLRRIRVEVHPPDGRRLITRTRNAYLAGQAGQSSPGGEAGHGR
jgi:Ca-activated chloride channel family protein